MFRRDSDKRKTGAVLWTADAAVFVLSVAVAGLLLASYAAPYVDPNRVIWFAFLGLVAPFLYVANGLLTLYWVLRWKSMAIVMGAVLLLGAGHVTKFFRPELRRDYQQSRTEGTLRILSYNVGGFLGDRNGQRVNQMNDVTAYIREENPDIICLQEYEVNRLHPRHNFDDSLEAWKHRAVFYTFGADQAQENGWGLAVYSKYPIVSKAGIRYPESTNASLWVDVVVHRDTIRVFNNHLQTTQIDRGDKDFIENEAFGDSSRNDKVKGILRKLKRNFQKRALQADSVARFIHDGTSNVVVCGDFNDTPMSYTYHTMRGGFVDAFQRKGRGLVVTYKGLFGVLRIDYIFHSKDFETVSYEAAHPEWSDHNPVIVELKLKQK